MPTPPTNNTFTDIFFTSNNVGPSSMVSLLTSSFFSYFSGPQGSNNQPANNWGLGEASGSNRIYLTTAKTTNLKVSDFSNKWYFYQQTIHSVQYDASNNSPNPITPPDPPDCYDMNVNLTLYDSTLAYPYLANNYNLSPGRNESKDIITIVPPDTVPLINTYYWKIDVNTSPTYPGSSGNVTVRIDINGINFLNGVTINPGSNSFTSSTYGTASIELDQPITGITGSLFVVTIS